MFGGAPSDQAAINHGTYFYWASQEGLIKNGSSIASIMSLFDPQPLSPMSITEFFDPSLFFQYSMAPSEPRYLDQPIMLMTMPLASNELRHVRSTL